jgi:hypothetical protein
MSATVILVLTHAGALVGGGVLGYRLARRRLRRAPRHSQFRIAR